MSSHENSSILELTINIAVKFMIHDTVIDDGTCNNENHGCEEKSFYGIYFA